MQAKSFVEVGLNLHKLGLDNAVNCVKAVQVVAHTRTSVNFTNNLEDIALMNININTFATISVKKYFDSDGLFSTLSDTTPKTWGLALYKGSVSTANKIDSAVSTNKLGPYDTLVQGKYIVVETDSANWSHLGIVRDSSHTIRSYANTTRRDTFTVQKSDTIIEKLYNSRNRISTTTSVSSNDDTSGFGQSVIFTATVLPITASGTATFYDGAISLGTGTVSNGIATLTTSSLSVGNHSITAVYSGDMNYYGSTSSAITQVVKYVLTITQPVNGTIAPSGTILVNYGGSQTFTITPNAGYRIDSIFVNGAYVGSTSPYTLSNITGNSSITVKFAIRTYTITVTQGANGTIAPGTTTVNYGANQTFSVTPNTGYHIDSVIVDGANVGAGTSVTFNNVTANHTLTARYAIDVFTITVTNPTNGTITPSGTISVNYGGSQTFTITPNAGYRIDSIFVNGAYVGSTSPYTLSNITGNSSITVKFAIRTYTITVTQGANGTIAPGTTTVNYGANQTFSVTPNTGYHIDSVIVDGANVGAGTSVTFNNVTANHTLTARYAIDVFTITVTNPTNGTITPSGTISVNYGGSQTFAITPNAGYRIDSIFVNGAYVGNTSPYTLSNITGNSSITVKFAIRTYTITVTQGANGTIAPGTTTVNYGANQTFSVTRIRDIILTALS